jgi:SAM-dependent methyltransferase
VPASEILGNQIAYYQARAATYDQAYDPSERPMIDDWRADMTALTAAFDAVPIVGDVLEIAAGTGRWTERVVRRASRVTALDAAPEMVAINCRRLGPFATRVDYIDADVFAWKPDRTWDACVSCFWVCHVPDEQLARFAATVASAVRTSGLVVFADKAMPPSPAPPVVARTVGDQLFTIIDRPRSTAELVEPFAAAGIQLSVNAIGSRFVLGQGKRL